jgi:UDP-N-acetylmuramate--alanine ligase
MSTVEQPWAGRRLHFIGVGGAGMSGYARAAHALGASVSGSDRAPSAYLERLRKQGVLDAHIGHDASNVPAGDDVEIVYSSAVPADNPERVAARERGLAERPRAELLGELTALRPTIAVAGAHGKTTTASMIVHMLRDQGADPSWLVGASVGAGLDNSYWAPTRTARTGTVPTDPAPAGPASIDPDPTSSDPDPTSSPNGPAEWLVVEADESDRSMLSLNVEIAVLTNVELDHHATFSSLAELREAFREFLAGAPQAVVWDRAELRALRDGPAVFYDIPVDDILADDVPADDVPVDGIAAHGIPAHDIPALAREGDPTASDGTSHFQWRGQEVELAVPGAHNALNATGALEAARLAGVDEQGAVASLAGFRGAGRRFQRVGHTARGAVVIDDYAHHPTEVAATLSAARTFAPRRLVAVFQPHLYSRTAMLAREFGAALAQADVIAVLDVYPARERAEDHPGVSGLEIVRAATERAGGRPVLWLPGFDAAQSVLGELLEDGDLCVVMGAGDVDALTRRLVA